MMSFAKWQVGQVAGWAVRLPCGAINRGDMPSSLGK